MADRIKIINGPSKWDLMLALFEKSPVGFKLSGDIVVNIEVRALSDERHWETITFGPDTFTGGMDDTWLIEGDLEEQPEDGGAIYVAYIAYSTITRQGVFRCVADGAQKNSDPDEPHRKLLRYEWGNRVWGDDSWQ